MAASEWVSGFRTFITGEQSVASYVWDTNALAWTPMLASSGVGSSVNVTNTSIPVSQFGTWSITTTPGPLQTQAKGSTALGYPTSEATDANTQSLHCKIVNGSLAVTGTFYQATQPVSLASLPALATGANTIGAVNVNGTVPVSGTFWQSTQPVSIASMPSTPVTGTFWQTTQPVSLTSTTITGTVAATQSGTWNIGSLTSITNAVTVGGAVASGVTASGNPVPIGLTFNTTQPTVTTGQAVQAQGTARGAQIVATGADTFNVTVNAAIPTGANVIGAVTQSGTWNIGSITTLPALVAGAAIIGKVGIDQTTPGTTNLVSIGTNGTVAINAAIPTGANTIGNVTLNALTGTLAAGTSATNSLLAGGVYNTTLPAPTNGQQVALQLDNNGAQLVNNPDIKATATLNALNVAATVIVVGGKTGVLIQVKNTSASLSFLVEGTIDGGTTWWAIDYCLWPYSQNGNPSTAATVYSASAANNVYLAACSGFQQVRVRCSAYTSGSSAVTMALSAGTLLQGITPNFYGVRAGAVTSVSAAPASNGNQAATYLITDKNGRLITVNAHERGMTAVQQTTITASTTETTVITTGGAGVFNDITLLSFSNSSATPTLVTLKDATAGTTRGIWSIPAAATIIIPFQTPLAQATASNNWTITCGTSVSSIYIVAQYVKNN